MNLIFTIVKFTIVKKENDLMDMEEFARKSPNDPLALLVAQDLERFSLEELDARIMFLEAELERVRKKRRQADVFRTEAQALFKKI
jgi:uncharacterized small protein (DUF1192 family)